MHVYPDDIPDPIQRNRRERRLAWIVFALLLALGWLVAPLAEERPADPGAAPRPEAAGRP